LLSAFQCLEFLERPECLKEAISGRSLKIISEKKEKIINELRTRRFPVR
jgi:hypothetical protein